MKKLNVEILNFREITGIRLTNSRKPFHNASSKYEQFVRICNESGESVENTVKT